MATRLHDAEFDSERQTLSETTYKRTYSAGIGATISELGLTQGTVMPGVSGAKITEAWLDKMRPRDPKTGKLLEGWTNVARVVAIKFNTGA